MRSTVTIIAALIAALSYWWHIQQITKSHCSQIITVPYASSPNKTHIEHLVLDHHKHTSWQFPLAVLKFLVKHQDAEIVVPIAGWKQLLNVTAKTEMGQELLKGYDLDQVVLMKDQLKYYPIMFDCDVQISIDDDYTERIHHTIDNFFGSEPKTRIYESINLTPNDFILDTHYHVQRLPERQQHFLTDNITEYRYFKEGSLLKTGGLSHYELRFFEERMSPLDRVAVLHRIARAWARFTQMAGIHTWIAHGSLLGYYFNGMILPWDDDLDVQVTAKSFWKLVEHNMTIVMDFNDAEAIGTYLIDVNPWFINRQRNPDNKIDARFIDLETGLYIDITTLTSELIPTDLMKEMDGPETEEFYKVFDPYHEPIPLTETETYEESIYESINSSLSTRSLISCKDLHFYRAEELTPLIPTVFEGEIIYVPNNINNMLQREYSRKSLYLLDYNGFTFDKFRRIWTHPEVTSEYNHQINAFVEHHYKIKQSTFKRHIFESENLIKFPNFKVDPQIRNLTS